MAAFLLSPPAQRGFASDATARLGLRIQPSLFETTSTSFRSAAARAYATVQDGLKYAESHEWAKIEGDVATVGISDFAQAELGDIVFVELPEVGSTLEKGSTFGVVESVKAASDVYSPISGEVVEVNETLSDDPQKVNSDSFGAGWLMKVKVSDPSEADSLHDSKSYEKFCEDSAH